MTCWPDTSSKRFNHEERSLWILFFILCVAYFARDVQSLRHVFILPCDKIVCFYYA